MAHSLRCKLSKLRYKGEITEEEYRELIDKLDDHDKDLRGLQNCIDSLSTPQGQHFLELLDEISKSQIYEGTMDR